MASASNLVTVARPQGFLSVDPSGIPRELTGDDAWLPALPDKAPGDAQGRPARWSDSASWLSFDRAFMAYEGDGGRCFVGVGYVLHGTGVVALDLDHCVSPDGTIAPWAVEIMSLFPGAHWTLSISRTGLRGLTLGTLPGGVGGRRGTIGGCSVEVYSRDRYIIVTGHVVRRVDALVDETPAIAALVSRLGADQHRVTGAGVLTGLTGRLTHLNAAELAILGSLMAGHKGARMATIWARDDPDATECSEEDFSLAKGLAYHAIRRGLDGEALARTVERIMRAGPFREKWDERRGAVTWLAQDVANAIATVREWRGGEGAAGGAPRPIRGGSDGESACDGACQTATALRADLDRERDLRARDRRLALAEQRLDRVPTFSPGQKAAIKAVARIAPALANSLKTDAPIITRQAVAEVTGAKVPTVGGHLAVFDLRGSPVRRESKRYGTKELTHYRPGGRDSAAIIEEMAALGERLETRPSGRVRRRCRRCPEGTGTVVQIICAGCGGLLEDRRGTVPSGAPALQQAEKPSAGNPTGTQQAEKPSVAAGSEPPGRPPVIPVPEGPVPPASLPADAWTRPAALDRMTTAPDDPDPPRCVRVGRDDPAADRHGRVCSAHASDGYRPPRSSAPGCRRAG